MADAKAAQSTDKGDSEDDCDGWEVDWNSPELLWHIQQVHPMLTKHEREITGGRTHLKILVPLCGISLDLLWFAEQGHSVVGIEYDAKGCEAFFQINNIDFETSDLGQEYKVFKGKSKDITLYQCDFFALLNLVPSLRSSFDVIWDRAALRTTVNEPPGTDAQSYLNVLREFVAPGGVLAQENTRFELKDFSGEHYPGIVSDEMVEKLAKEKWEVKKVDQIDYEKGEGVEPFYRVLKHNIALHLLTPK